MLALVTRQRCDVSRPSRLPSIADLGAQVTKVEHPASHGAALLGIDPAAVVPSNPTAITVAMTGYGETGPRHLPGGDAGVVRR